MSVLSQLADALPPLKPSDIGVTDAVKSADSVVTSILNTAYFWAGIICVLIIIAAGFLYVTSSGNATNVKRAKDAIIGAVIGLVVIILAFTITQFIVGRF